MDLSNYTPDGGELGLRFYFYFVDLAGNNDYAWISTWQNSASNFHVQSSLVINGGAQNDTDTGLTSCPTSLRLKRVGTVITSYYYYSGAWVQLDTRDYTTEASKLIGTQFEYYTQGATDGGYVDVDDLIFHMSCPAGYPKAWTTTTTTTTCTTTSCCSSSSSTASTLSTLSTTTSSCSSSSSTASTLSTLSTTTSSCSSSSSTASTLSTISTTTSSCSSTSSTASTLSTLSTTTSSTITTTTTTAPP